jgi:heme/copper-type cytochrome/quinol oxidase subunit 1
MAATPDTYHADDGHRHHHKPNFVSPWLFRANHKDIGTLYLILPGAGGLSGMPRRYPDYPAAFVGWNDVFSVAAYVSGIAFLAFLYARFCTFISKEHVTDSYWGAGATTLEWTQTSPPAFHTYLECHGSRKR